MKLPHALGFVAHGLLLAALSSYAPGLFAGASARELWVAFMSWVNLAVGAGWLAHRAFVALLPWLRYDFTAASLLPPPSAAAAESIEAMDTFEPAFAVSLDVDREAA